MSSKNFAKFRKNFFLVSTSPQKESKLLCLDQLRGYFIFHGPDKILIVQNSLAQREFGVSYTFSQTFVVVKGIDL